jgi:hypothetical protein
MMVELQKENLRIAKQCIPLICSIDVEKLDSGRQKIFISLLDQLMELTDGLLEESAQKQFDFLDAERALLMLAFQSEVQSCNAEKLLFDINSLMAKLCEILPLPTEFTQHKKSTDKYTEPPFIQDRLKASNKKAKKNKNCC